MSHGACCFVVFLAELTDGIGAFQVADGLVVVRQKRRIEVSEIIIDLVRHLLMFCVKAKLLAIKQTMAEPREMVLQSMLHHAICQGRHLQGRSHLLVGQCLLFVEHGEQ